MKNLSSDTGWVPVHFEEDEQEEIIQVGSSRRGAKEASGIYSEEQLQADYQHGTDGHVMAFAAEYALAKALGVEADTEISRGGNGGKHVKIEVPTGELDENSFQEHREVTLNASWIGDPTWDMRYNPNRIPGADIYMLVFGDGLKSMRIIGGISSDQFRKKCRERDFGFGLRLVVGQEKLAPPRKIMRYLGAGGRLEELDEAHREKRLQHEAQFGSLFDESHQDPA